MARRQTTFAAQAVNRQPIHELAFVGGLFAFNGDTMRIVESPDRMKQTGVYAIVHVASGKRYVGSSGRSFSIRFRDHHRALRKGRHHSGYLQQAWDKHGESAFEFRIEEITPPEHALACEQVFIDWRNSSDRKCGYNRTPTAGSLLGFRHSDEMCKAHGKRIKMFFANNPEAGPLHGKKLKRFYEENPELRMAARERSKRQFEDNAARQLNSMRTRKFFEEHPEARLALGARIKKRYEENPELRIANRERMKKFYEDNPNAGTAHSAKLTKYYVDNPDMRLSARERTKKQFATVESRIAAGNRAKAAWADPVRKAEIIRKARATREAKKSRKTRMIQHTLFDVE